MTRFVTLSALLALAAPCLSQETTINDAKRGLAKAKEAVDEGVAFCVWCNASGKLEGKKCEHCTGLGAMLKQERKYIEQKRELESTAVAKGRSASEFAEFDIAHRLDAYEKKYDEQAFEALAAYVGYLKVCREYADLIKEDEAVAAETKKMVDAMDLVADRYGLRLRLDSLKLLYEDDPAGKVGTFVLYGKKGVVKIDGQDADRYQLRTLKNHDVLIRTDGAKQRKGYLLAEIVGKDTYTTDDGKEIKAILLQAY